MIVVTGAAGFIGSNLVAGLNRAGYSNILAVDNLEDGKKFFNLATCEIADYMDKQQFREQILSGDFKRKISSILHQGACSDTTLWDGKYMLDNNYQYSKDLLQFCIENDCRFIYASSAAVYGGSREFIEDKKYEQPINVYAYSKYLFDHYVRRLEGLLTTQVVGLRYFNVYGRNEQHKGAMASVAYHLYQQLKASGKCNLFGAYDGYAKGEQLRDFIHVNDVVKVNLWLLENPQVSGIFNCGTGKAASFNAVAAAVIKAFGSGDLNYIPFPDKLKGSYQSYTQANIDSLRQAGYAQDFLSVADGVAEYANYLANAPQ